MRCFDCAGGWLEARIIVEDNKKFIAIACDTCGYRQPIRRVEEVVHENREAKD